MVKVDTWRPGRPHSTVVDHSRSPSFSVPTLTGPEPIPPVPSP